jgi:hypothetical protein
MLVGEVIDVAASPAISARRRFVRVEFLVMEGETAIAASPYL